MKIKLLSRIIAVLLALILCAGILVGCTSCDDREDIEERQRDDDEPEVIIVNDDDFDLLMDELFEEWVTTDALSMNYYLADPYRLNIERPDTNFGDVISQELIEESRQETQELSDRLDGFLYDSLRDDQKIVYDILMRSIRLYRILEKEDDYYYYTGYIRPLNGLQVQLPILLAEFSFYEPEDIERYLEMIGDTVRYFNDIIEFERERSRRGYFLCEANTDSVIEQIEGYLENREDNLLITVFDYRIDNYEGLSSEQRESFKQRNKELVLDNVLVAYDTLLEAMKELRGTGSRQGGLAALPGGAEYANASMRLRIGSDRSVEEWGLLLENWLNITLMEILEALHGGPQLIDRYVDDELGQIPDGTPKSYIAELRKLTAKDFPPIAETQLELLEVHESLQEHMSPAFYLTPAVDRFNENVVYVNPSSINDNLFMYTVLAHESYPGHMYQTVYFLQQSPHPVRTALSNTGYSEGWATYAENVSYFFADIDETEANLLWNLRLFDMLLGAYVDLGVNMMDWSIEFVTELFEELGLNLEVVEDIYNRATGVPLMSMTYAMGYIEMTMLISDAQELMGSDFYLKEFHRFVLDFGPAPFPIIRDRLYSYFNGSVSDSLQPAA